MPVGAALNLHQYWNRQIHSEFEFSYFLLTLGILHFTGNHVNASASSVTSEQVPLLPCGAEGMSILCIL